MKVEEEQITEYDSVSRTTTRRISIESTSRRIDPHPVCIVMDGVGHNQTNADPGIQEKAQMASTGTPRGMRVITVVSLEPKYTQ